MYLVEDPDDGIDYLMTKDWQVVEKHECVGHEWDFCSRIHDIVTEYGFQPPESGIEGWHLPPRYVGLPGDSRYFELTKVK